MTLADAFKLTPGDKVLFIPEKKIYDFGYISRTHKVIIYEVGEINGQDASAVSAEDLIHIEDSLIMISSPKDKDGPTLTMTVNIGTKPNFANGYFTKIFKWIFPKR